LLPLVKWLPLEKDVGRCGPNAEVQTLLQVWSEQTIQTRLHDATQNTPIYDEMSKTLKEHHGVMKAAPSVDLKSKITDAIEK
jgi:hypothetical protein